MGMFRNDSKLVVGTSKGRLYTFNWNEFGYHNTMYPGPKTPMSHMIPITDRVAVVAGEEGKIITISFDRTMNQIFLLLLLLIKVCCVRFIAYQDVILVWLANIHWLSMQWIFVIAANTLPHRPITMRSNSGILNTSKIWMT